MHQPGYHPDMFTEDREQALLCPICQYIIRKAVACKEGHLFCKACIDQWINVHNRRNCPVGRQPLQASDLRNIIAFDRVVESCQVFCPRREEGCSWTGSLEMTTNHKRQCLQEPVQCTLPGCNQAMTRGQLDGHLDTCDMREAQCRHCNTRLPFRHRNNHERFACRRAPVVCPFNCNDHAIPREQLNGHIDTDCTRAFVTCTVPACTFKLRRENQANHLAGEAPHHVDLLLAERRANQRNGTAPSTLPGRVRTFDWNISQFPQNSNLGPAVGLKSPLFGSSLRIIMVPKMSTAGNMGVFLCNQETDPVCLNASVALRNGSDIFLKRTPVANWINNHSPLGWESFLPLDEVRRRYVDLNGNLSVQISYQLLG